MLNGWLVTAETVQKPGPHELQVCLFCGQAETTSHLMLCCKTERATTIDTHLSSLWNNIESTIPLALLTSLQDTIKKWRTASDDDTIIGYKSVLASQSFIGWDEFFRGRITTEFYTDISQYLLSNGHRNHHRAAQAKCVSLIHELWKYNSNLWQSQNRRTADTSRPEPTIQRSKWQSTVRYFYANQHYFPSDDRQTLFAIPVDRLCSATVETLSAWCT